MRKKLPVTPTQIAELIRNDDLYKKDQKLYTLANAYILIQKAYKQLLEENPPPKFNLKKKNIDLQN